MRTTAKVDVSGNGYAQVGDNSTITHVPLLFTEPWGLDKRIRGTARDRRG